MSWIPPNMWGVATLGSLVKGLRTNCPQLTKNELKFHLNLGRRLPHLESRSVKAAIQFRVWYTLDMDETDNSFFTVYGTQMGYELLIEKLEKRDEEGVLSLLGPAFSEIGVDLTISKSMESSLCLVVLSKDDLPAIARYLREDGDADQGIVKGENIALGIYFRKVNELPQKQIRDYCESVNFQMDAWYASLSFGSVLPIIKTEGDLISALLNEWEIRETNESVAKLRSMYADTFAAFKENPGEFYVDTSEWNNIRSGHIESWQLYAVYSSFNLHSGFQSLDAQRFFDFCYKWHNHLNYFESRFAETPPQLQIENMKSKIGARDLLKKDFLWTLFEDLSLNLSYWDEPKLPQLYARINQDDPKHRKFYPRRTLHGGREFFHAEMDKYFELYPASEL